MTDGSDSTAEVADSDGARCRDVGSCSGEHGGLSRAGSTSAASETSVEW